MSSPDLRGLLLEVPLGLDDLEDVIERHSIPVPVPRPATHELRTIVQKATAHRPGRAEISTVWVSCPYCKSSEVICTESGSMLIEWRDTSPLQCLDCNRYCSRPRHPSRP